MELKFFIRTTGERKLDPSIKRELGDQFSLLVDWDHKPVDSFIEQLNKISDYDAILLEDDVILCKDFVNEVKKAIRKWKGQIINFFGYPHEYCTSTLCTFTFAYNQCTYYPKGIAKQIAKKMIELRESYNQYDTLENKALRALNLPHVRFRPCLVQHIDNNTLIQKSNNNKRRTIWFKDYLDELGIDLKEAYTVENKQKLTELLNKQFNIK